MTAEIPREMRDIPPRALDGASWWWWLIIGAVALGLWVAIGAAVLLVARL